MTQSQFFNISMKYSLLKIRLCDKVIYIHMGHYNNVTPLHKTYIFFSSIIFYYKSIIAFFSFHLVLLASNICRVSPPFTTNIKKIYDTRTL